MNLKLQDGQYLVELPVTVNKERNSARNVIIALDRSGSTSWFSNKLIDDSQEQIHKIEFGSTVTIVEFSSEGGDFSNIVKGMKLSSVEDKVRVCKALDQYRRARNLTCFSEMLSSLDQTMSDVALLSGNDEFSLFLFTDGCPVVRNYENEVLNIFKAIDIIADRISNSIVLGYGNWYDKELLSKMTSRLGGTLLHAGSMTGYTHGLNSFVSNKSKFSRIKVNVNVDVTIAFSINNGMLTTYYVKDGIINYSPSDNGKIYYVSQYVDGDTVRLSENNVYERDDLAIATYALALLYSQQSKGDKALETLALTGDKYIIDMLTNAYTNAEYGNVERKLQNIINDGDTLVQGYVRNYVSDRDTFSLVDTLFLLESDINCKFYPSWMKSYNRIGKKAKTNDAPKFNPIVNPNSKLKLIWNKTRLNVSVQATIDGYIDIPVDEADMHGLPHKYKNTIYRTYTIIKDGTLNMDSLPVSMSEPVFDKLQEEGVIDIYEQWFIDSVYNLDLTNVPIINRDMALNNKSAERLAKLTLRSLRLSAQYKTFGFYKEYYYPREKTESDKLSNVYDSDAVEYLKSIYITDRGFNPKVMLKEATDYYEALNFDIKVKGLSSLPSINAVLKKLKTGKNLTVSQSMIAEVMDELLYDIDNPIDTISKENFEIWIKEVKVEQNKVRREIQEAKFAVILGKQWFDEFDSRSDNKLSLNGFDYTFELKKVKIEY